MGEKETGAADEAERLKTKTKSNQSNDRIEQGGGGAAATDVTNDPETTWESSNLAGGGGDAPEAAINNSHSNIKNLREGGGITHEDDWHDAGKLAPDKPGKSEIAIGDPGVNGNITGDAPEIAAAEPGVNTGLAVTDEGVPAAKPAPKSN